MAPVPSATTGATDVQAEAVGAAREHAHARRVEVGGHDEAVVPHAFGRRARLAARRGREVEDAFARLRVEHADDGLAGLVLRRCPAVAHRGQRTEVARMAHHERVAARSCPGATSTPAVAQLALDLGDRRPQRVDAQGDRRCLVGDRQCRDRVGVAELVAQRMDDPVRMGRAHAQGGVVARRRATTTVARFATAPAAHR